jgi:hypothetical protein
MYGFNQGNPDNAGHVALFAQLFGGRPVRDPHHGSVFSRAI